MRRSHEKGLWKENLARLGTRSLNDQDEAI